MKRFLNYIAGSFLRHLDFELSRPDLLLETVVVGEKTPREWTLPVREGLLELLREITYDLYPDEEERRGIWEIIYQQNLEHQGWMTEHRGSIPAENKGNLSMYQLHRLRPEFCSDSVGLTPKADFYHVLEDRIGHCCPRRASIWKK